jgi:hypothetical protein
MLAVPSAGRNPMNSERLISLKIDVIDGYNLVSSPEFPLLHLSIADDSYEDIETCVLPILKEMIERERGGSVTLRLIKVYGHDEPNLGFTSALAPHIIAQVNAA